MCLLQRSIPERGVCNGNSDYSLNDYGIGRLGNTSQKQGHVLKLDLLFLWL